MTVTVKLIATFAKYLENTDNGRVTLSEGATVRDLAEKLGLPIKYVRIIAVNGTQGDLGTLLSESDEVFIFPPALGGG